MVMAYRYSSPGSSIGALFHSQSILRGVVRFLSLVVDLRVERIFYFKSVSQAWIFLGVTIWYGLRHQANQGTRNAGRSFSAACKHTSKLRVSTFSNRGRVFSPLNEHLLPRIHLIPPSIERLFKTLHYAITGKNNEPPIRRSSKEKCASLSPPAPDRVADNVLDEHSILGTG